MECFVPPRETETLAAAAFKVRLRTIKAQYCRVILGFAFSIPRISVLPGGARVPAYELLRRRSWHVAGAISWTRWDFIFERRS